MFLTNTFYLDREIDSEYSLHLGEDNIPKVWSNLSNRYLNQWYTSDKYFRTKLHGKNVLIHKLVADCFLGKRRFGFQVNHIDGNKENNHPSNLEYCTQQENLKHAIRLGLHVASDPKRMPTYKDGRCTNKKEYQRLWAKAKRENAHAI